MLAPRLPPQQLNSYTNYSQCQLYKRCTLPHQSSVRGPKTPDTKTGEGFWVSTEILAEHLEKPRFWKSLQSELGHRAFAPLPGATWIGQGEVG